jgi:hypothetical protein
MACRDKVDPVQPTAVRGGVIEAAETSFDFGEVVRGTVVKHVFTVKNTGDAPVKILSVKAGCSCTAAIVSNPDVAPGSTAGIEVSFNTKGRRGFQSKSVKVMTDSAINPGFTVAVSGRVEPAVTFSPENIELGQVARGSVVVREVEIAGIQADGVKIESIEVTPAGDDRFSAEVVAEGGPGASGRKIRVTFKSLGEYGQFRGRVAAVTNSPIEPQIGFGLSAEVTGDIVADTAVVKFPPRGDVSPAGQTTQKSIVKLMSLSRTPFRFLGIRDASGLIKVALTEPVEGGFQITFVGPLVSEPVEGEFFLMTDRKGEDPLKMYFTAGKKDPARVESGRFGNDRRQIKGSPGLPGKQRFGTNRIKQSRTMSGLHNR